MEAGFAALCCEFFTEWFLHGQVVNGPREGSGETYPVLVGVEEISDVTAQIEYITQPGDERGEVEKDGKVAFPYGVRDRSVKANLVRVFMAGPNVLRCTSLGRCERRKVSTKTEKGIQHSSQRAIGAYARYETAAEGAAAQGSEN